MGVCSTFDFISNALGGNYSCVHQQGTSDSANRMSVLTHHTRDLDYVNSDVFITLESICMYFTTRPAKPHLPGIPGTSSLSPVS